MIEVLRRMTERNMPDDVTGPFDVNTSSVEADITALIRHRRPSDYAPPAVRQPRSELPSYVKHAEGADEIAKLTAHAIIKQYEELALTLEKLRDPLMEQADGHQKALDNLHAEMKRVDDSVQRVRDLGTQAFEQFQKTAGVIAEVRRVCDDACDKIEPAT